MSSTNRGSTRRENDAYYTPAWCVRALLKNVNLPGGEWLEPAYGGGAIVKTVKSLRGDVRWTVCDCDEKALLPFAAKSPNWILGRYTSEGLVYPKSFKVVITNPPFDQTLDFVKGAMKDGKIVVMLLRLNWLASKARNRFLLDNPPSVYVLPKRPCFTGDGKTDSCEYAWFVWGLHDRPECRVISMEDCEADLSVALARGK